MKRPLLTAAIFLVCTVLVRAEIHPPFQFRLIDPVGKVELASQGGEKTLVEARAVPGVGDVVTTGKSSGVTLAIANFGMIYLRGESQLRFVQVAEDGKPLVDLGDGGMLLKTLPLGAQEPLTFTFGSNQMILTDALLEVRYKASRQAALVSVLRGKVNLTNARTQNKTLEDLQALIRGDGRMRTKGVEKQEVVARWKYLGEAVFKPEVPELPDEVAPQVKILTPTSSSTQQSSAVEVYGTVDDPTIDQVQIKIEGVFQVFGQAADGQFRGNVILRRPSQTIQVVATDEAGNSGRDQVTVRCASPAAPLEAPDTDEAPGFVERSIATLRDPAKDPQFFFMLVGGALLLVVVVLLLIRKALGLMKSGAQTAAGLATGVIFHRCEKCGEREFEYHLFYTAEPVASPFMRNLINNVNPMATSIMNESLENLLNTGLSGSASAKSQEQKIRVTCTWCDSCKVGNLKLEHMKGQEVVKTDDYQIIHPIFIEWVRKVYD